MKQREKIKPEHAQQMVLQEDLFTGLKKGLPDYFKFYHLGEVQLQSKISRVIDPETDTGIAYQLTGDLSAMFILFFDHQLDQSIYSELGNIIVGRIATKLQKIDRLEIKASPPEVLSRIQIAEILSPQQRRTQQDYLHTHNESIQTIGAVFLRAPLEDFGHA